MYESLIIASLSLFVIGNAYLTPVQQRLIQNIIQDPRVPESAKNEVRNRVFLNYLPWIRKECNSFVETNPNLMTFIHHNSAHRKSFYCYRNEELFQDMCRGFSKALVRFNGNCSTLTHYSMPYMKREIYAGITISTKQWRYKYTIENTLNVDSQRGLVRPESSPLKEGFREIYAIVHDPRILTPTERQLMYYRYNLETLQKIRTIPNVCEIMGFSEETYRKYHKKIVAKIGAAIRDRGESLHFQ
jgi:DNA-directed RNA polymerase specialized sigma subunit